MEDVAVVVDELLARLSAASGLPDGMAPADVVVSSMDQMRLLVGLEEELDVMLDVTDLEPFDLSSRDALVESVRTMLAQAEALS